MQYIKNFRAGKLELVKLADKNGEFLKYAIRDLDPIAEGFGKFGISMFKDNIGDPIVAGVKAEQWIVGIIAELAKDYKKSWRYPKSGGELESREFLAEQRNERGGIKIAPDDIVFHSGSGEGISEINARLAEGGILLVPSPGYPTHSSFQANHIGRESISYKLDPSDNWLPDLNDIEEKIIANKNSVKGVIVVNPNNPTGSVLPKGMVKEIAGLCCRHGILPIFDECYANLVYNGAGFTHLGDVIGDSAGISMRSVSKDIPWPGARCGWLEAYNQDKHKSLAEYFGFLKQAKTMQVGSTTLPQLAIPLVYGNPKFKEHLKRWNRQLEEGGNLRAGYINKIKGLSAIPPKGAFYIAAVFEKDILNNRQSVPVMECKDKAGAGQHLKSLLNKEPDMPLDKRFVLYLMANGIFVVHLTGFGSSHYGFRVTTLNPDKEKVEEAYKRLSELTGQYLGSA